LSQANKEVTRRYFRDVLSTQRLETADEILAPDFTCIDATGSVISGVDDFKAMLRAAGTASPHRDVEILDEVEEGNTVMSVFRLRMEHVGEFMGHPPTGKLVDITGVDVFHFEDGQIQDLRVFYNALTVFEQLGIQPGG
jgi:steroid delta-isomerase-like uncharacterized protein